MSAAKDESWTRSHTQAEFDGFLALAKGSVASPAWFAPLVAAAEEPRWYSLAFDLSDSGPGEVSVECGERSVQLSAATAANGRRTRICLLGDRVEPGSVEVSRTGPLLEVRVRKRAGPPPPPPPPRSAPP